VCSGLSVWIFGCCFRSLSFSNLHFRRRWFFGLLFAGLLLLLFLRRLLNLFHLSFPKMLIGMTRLWPDLLGMAQVVQPETILRWHRAGFKIYWRWKSRNRAGRPKIDRGLRDLIRRTSRENRLWGASRIHGELLMLGFEVAQSTVSKYMVRPSTAVSLQQRCSIGCAHPRCAGRLVGGIAAQSDKIRAGFFDCRDRKFGVCRLQFLKACNARRSQPNRLASRFLTSFTLRVAIFVSGPR
jgi:hypothetical protein